MSAVKIHRGITRTVLLAGRWAVKVPSLRTHSDGVRGVMWSLCRGISANLSECQWSGSPGVCPVRWSLLAGVVNVYPRCAPVDPDHVIDWEGIGFLAPTDRKHQNVGWFHGHIVMVDYDGSWNDCPHGHPPRPRIQEESS